MSKKEANLNSNELISCVLNLHLDEKVEKELEALDVFAKTQNNDLAKTLTLLLRHSIQNKFVDTYADDLISVVKNRALVFLNELSKVSGNLTTHICNDIHHMREDIGLIHASFKNINDNKDVKIMGNIILDTSSRIQDVGLRLYEMSQGAFNYEAEHLKKSEVKVLTNYLNTEIKSSIAVIKENSAYTMDRLANVIMAVELVSSVLGDKKDAVASAVKEMNYIPEKVSAIVYKHYQVNNAETVKNNLQKYLENSVPAPKTRRPTM